MIGTVFGNRYRVDAKLGEGGMGVVYKAHDSLLQRSVAIKTLTPALLGADGVRRFLREAQSSASLNHPHIVSIFDVVEEGGSFAIVMELVEGKTLRELLPLPIDRLIEITTQILQGLEYAHAQGIVHRDIKPENIVIAADGIAKLMDFGLARSEGRSRLTQTGLIVGTVSYLAPEQALGGQVDGRSDLYSLGAVLYEAVTGHPPFASEDPISVITQHINVPPVAPHWHNPAVPQGLETVILKLLAKDPLRRYQTAREVLEALTSVRTATPSSPTVGPEKLAGPELVQRIVHSPMVGREAELLHLRELIDRAIAGRGGVVLINGPLGVGKTRLVDEAATFARMRGVTVVSGKAYEGAPPFEPFVKVLRELARGVDSETLTARLGEFLPDLVALVPELERQVPKLPKRILGSPEDQKNRLFMGVARFLEETTSKSPLLLFLDDMHIADASSVELLQHVARRTETSRVLLVLAYRAEDVPSSPAGRMFGQVTHALSREAFCTLIALRPLGEEQVVDLITRMAGHPTRSVPFGQRIFEVTEGNPYFIEEVIKGLFEQGTLYIKDGHWSTDFDNIQDYSLLEVPTSVHSAVEARLRHLSDPTRQVLSHAAVIGRQFDFDTLRALTETDETSLLDRVEEAIRAQLIREVRGAGADIYEFAQPMLRQVLYDAIPRRRRRLLHRQVGEALEQLYARKLDAHLEALVSHFAEAEEPAKTLMYARRAAEKAAAVFAYDDAVSYLHQAIAAAQELDRPTERLELMEELGDSLFIAGRREQTIRAFEDALHFWKSLPSTSKVDGARLCRKLGEIGSRWAHYNPRTREHIREGLRLLESTPEHPERIKLIIAKAFDHHWHRTAAESDYRVAEECAQEGYQLAEAIGSLKDMSAALDALGGVYEVTTDFAKVLETAQKRVPIVERLNDPLERLDLHHMLSRAHQWLGQYPEAIRHAEQVHELASQSGRISYLFTSAVQVIRLYILWDRWDDAEQWCRLNDETENRLGIRAYRRPAIAACRALAAAVRGDLAEARRQESELQKAPTVHPALAWVPAYWRLRVAFAIGDYDRTRPILEEGLRLADTPWAKLEFHTLALEFASQAREWHYIDQFGDQSVEQARRSGARHHIGQDCRALGIHRGEHNRLDEAEAFLQEAVEVFRALDCRWELAKTLREFALLRRTQGDRDHAARLLQEALVQFEALRALPDVARTRALM